jgi:hypothetical protein
MSILTKMPAKVLGSGLSPLSRKRELGRYEQGKRLRKKGHSVTVGERFVKQQ